VETVNLIALQDENFKGVYPYRQTGKRKNHKINKDNLTKSKNPNMEIV